MFALRARAVPLVESCRTDATLLFQVDQDKDQCKCDATVGGYSPLYQKVLGAASFLERDANI